MLSLSEGRVGMVLLSLLKAWLRLSFLAFSRWLACSRWARVSSSASGAGWRDSVFCFPFPLPLPSDRPRFRFLVGTLTIPVLPLPVLPWLQTLSLSRSAGMNSEGHPDNVSWKERKKRQAFSLTAHSHRHRGVGPLLWYSFCALLTCSKQQTISHETVLG